MSSPGGHRGRETADIPVEYRVVLGFAGGGEILLAAGVPADLQDLCGLGPLGGSALRTAARTPRETPPVIVLPAASPDLVPLLDDVGVEGARLLVLHSDDPSDRAWLESISWGQWPRVGRVDLEYCPPRLRASTDALQGGVGLVVLGPVAAEPDGFTPMARLLPELRTASLPPRIAAQELEAARASAAASEATLRSLKSSASWRVTAPLRFVKRVLRNR